MSSDDCLLSREVWKMRQLFGLHLSVHYLYHVFTHWGGGGGGALGRSAVYDTETPKMSLDLKETNAGTEGTCKLHTGTT